MKKMQNNTQKKTANNWDNKADFVEVKANRKVFYMMMCKQEEARFQILNLIDRKKKRDLEKKIRKGVDFNINEYCRIMYSGWGRPDTHRLEKIIDFLQCD